MNRDLLYEIAQTPTEGKLFEVNPLGMDRSPFEKKRGDKLQERTRQIINEAFVEVDKQTQKYAESFYTMIPPKTWIDYKTVDELKQYAKDLRGQMADWVEQALEWAQRICNGESWETVCNNPDIAKSYRMIVWKNGCARRVGGSYYDSGYNTATCVFSSDYNSGFSFYDTVPLVVFKKK